MENPPPGFPGKFDHRFRDSGSKQDQIKSGRFSKSRLPVKALKKAQTHVRLVPGPALRPKIPPAQKHDDFQQKKYYRDQKNL